MALLLIPCSTSLLPHSTRSKFSNGKLVKLSPQKRGMPQSSLGGSIVFLAQAKRKAIEGVSDELNAIAAQNLDQAPARRRVRDAFANVHLHLDHLLFKAASRGIYMKESYVINSKGAEIFCKMWLPKTGTATKGVLYFCHGYGDTCTFFFEGIAKQIAAMGYKVYAMDYPGFGLSEGLHGFIPSFDALVDDVIEQYTGIKRTEASGLPHFLLGQSMGGAVALKVHLKQPDNWDGVLLVAPMCRIAEDMQPPKALRNAFIHMSNVFPEAKLVPQKDLAELAFRVPTKRKLTAYNVIAYSGWTRLKTAAELLEATKEIESQVDKVSAPLLVLHGAADKVTDPKVSKFLYEKANSRDKTLKLYDGSYHSILEGEPDERILEVLGDIVSWLDRHSNPSTIQLP